MSDKGAPTFIYTDDNNDGCRRRFTTRTCLQVLVLQQLSSLRVGVGKLQAGRGEARGNLGVYTPANYLADAGHISIVRASHAKGLRVVFEKQYFESATVRPMYAVDGQVICPTCTSRKRTSFQLASEATRGWTQVARKQDAN